MRDLKVVHKITIACISIGTVVYLMGCTSATAEINTPSTQTLIAHVPSAMSTITLDLNSYAFPRSIDPKKPHLFYLHGKIIEDQGIPAISPEYGAYEYAEILEAFRGYGFTVISEQRPKYTDGRVYASKTAEQVRVLLNAGVAPQDITVVGASKGAGIAVMVSNSLKNEHVNYVIMGICHPEAVADFMDAGIYLSGNVLSIYDASDNYAGSCQELFISSSEKGLSSHDEILLNIGTGHGILYKALDEWLVPAIHWANNVP